MAATKTNKSTIPTGNHPFMDWLGNFQTQITSLIGVNAPDGEPYFYPRTVSRWNNFVNPGINALVTDWNKVKVKNNRNTGDVKQFNDERKKFTKTLFRPFNKEFVLFHSQLSVAQRSVIGVLPVHDETRTAASQTVNQLFASWKMLGSCVIEFHCRTAEDASKASTPEGKVVQMAYLIAPPLPADARQPSPVPIGGAVAPQSPGDCPRQDISTRALFRKDFGAANIGGKLFIFFRWFDIHHNEKSGPWSQLYTIAMA